jgi:hypothetical protein
MVRLNVATDIVWFPVPIKVGLCAEQLRVSDASSHVPFMV